MVRLDGLTMPATGGVHVYFQPPSINAWRHRTSATNIAGNTTDLSHLLLDGNPCARVHVGQRTDFGPSNPHHIGVYYRGGANGRGAIFNRTLPRCRAASS